MSCATQSLKLLIGEINNGIDDWKNYRWNGKLRDGQEILIRTLYHSDKEKLHNFLKSQSKESIYFRFMGHKTSFSDKELERYVNIDYKTSMAIVGLINEKIVGIGRYSKIEEDPKKIEVSIIVDDFTQKKGLATLILYHLVNIARKNGIKTVTGEILLSNIKIKNLMKTAGAKISYESDGIAKVTLNIR